MIIRTFDKLNELRQLDMLNTDADLYTFENAINYGATYYNFQYFGSLIQNHQYLANQTIIPTGYAIDTHKLVNEPEKKTGFFGSIFGSLF